MKTNAVRLTAHPTSVNPPALITLTTDFGLSDPYVGTMKGVILSRCATARIIDLTHQIAPQDVLSAGLALADAHPYFPAGTLHVAVVDPGVGTERAILWVRTSSGQFLAPDNGLLSFLEPESILELRRAENPQLWLQTVSGTFHGRDIFAPLAGELAKGLDPASIGPPTRSLQRLAVPAPTTAAGRVRGQVLTFDHFGNARTNLGRSDLPAHPFEVRCAGKRLPFGSTYADVPLGNPLALLSSTGHLEISVHAGDARRQLGLERGTPVELVPGATWSAQPSTRPPAHPKENTMLVDANRSCLLVIDIQEKLVPAIHRSGVVVERCRWLIEIAQRLHVPVLASAQYPRGLGHTVEPIATALGSAQILEKLHFSCADDPDCTAALNALGRDQVVLIGMEAHVCVLQSALGLRHQGKEVFVVADAVSSRTPEDVELSLARLRQAGVWVVSREMVAFEWLRRSGTELFREISRAYLR